MHAHPDNNFDFLRFAAALTIWAGNCYALLDRQDPLAYAVPFETLRSLGVTVFFIISGYFITQSYDRHQNLMAFLRNRALRILPGLALATLLCSFVLGAVVTSLPTHTYLTHPQTWRYLRSVLIFPMQYDLPGVFQHNPVHDVNNSLWSLPHEVRCYLVIAVLGMLGILQPRVMMALFLGLLALLAYGALQGAHPPGAFFSIPWSKLSVAAHLGFLFSGGSLVYMHRGQIPRHFGFLTLCFLLMVLSTKFPPLWGTLLFDAATLYSVIYLGFLRAPIISHIGAFGDFSYGMYLYAFPMQQLTLQFLQQEHTPMVHLMAGSFIAMMLCAFASWHLVEKHMLKLKR